MFACSLLTANYIFLTCCLIQTWCLQQKYCRGEEPSFFNKVGNADDSLYFHVLILKEVKGKRHQPAETPFQVFFSPCPFPFEELPVPFPPLKERCEMLFNFVSVLQVNPAAGSSQFSCFLLQRLYRVSFNCCPYYPSVTLTFSCYDSCPFPLSAEVGGGE